MTKNDSQSRRSERILLSVALRASGQDSEGRAFECDTTTVSVNRYGARIRLNRTLLAEQTIHLQNLQNGLSSDFRVVGFVGSSESGDAEWGVEILGPDINFWDIYFPPRSSEPDPSAALLECGTCRTVGLLPISLPEVETLDAGATISKFCSRCQQTTDWRYPARSGTETPHSWTPETEPLSAINNDGRENSDPSARESPHFSPEPEGRSFVLAPAVENRKEPRRYVRRQITLRDSSGRSEVTRTENCSKNGVCLTSELDYATGQELTLIWPHGASGRVYQARAKIVRRHVIGGTVRKIYGLEYLGAPALADPSPQRPYRQLATFAGLIAAATVLLALGAFRLGMLLSFPAGTGSSLTELGVSILLLYAAHLVFRTEGESKSAKNKRYVRWWRGTQIVCGVLLAAAVGAGGWFGFRKGRRQFKTLRLVNDFSMSDAIERSIDQTEAFYGENTPSGDDAATRLDTLSGEWQKALKRVDEDWAQFRSKPDGSGPQSLQMNVIGQLLRIETRKLALVHAQIAALQNVAQFPTGARRRAAEENFQALRDQILRLNQQRERLIDSMAARRSR